MHPVHLPREVTGGILCGMGYNDWNSKLSVSLTTIGKVNSTYRDVNCAPTHSISWLCG